MGIYSGGSKGLRTVLLLAIALGGPKVLRYVWPCIIVAALLAAGFYFSR